MTQPKVLDLDKELGFTSDEPQHIKTVNLLGMPVRIVCDLNTFGLTNVTSGDGSTEAVMRFLESMIHPDDWPAFVKAASMHSSMRGDDGIENMLKMIRRVTEVASERPTKQPSDLPRGGSTRSTGAKSAASTGSGRAKASKTSP